MTARRRTGMFAGCLLLSCAAPVLSARIAMAAPSSGASSPCSGIAAGGSGTGGSGSGASAAGGTGNPLPVENPALPAAPPNPAASLGGYRISASGAGMSLYYEQPNFPIPATPTVEGDLGYSTATFASGPAGSATASTLYPGQVVAGSGSQLSTLVPGLPSAPNWPIQAVAVYPQGPGSATNDQTPGVSMDATAAVEGTLASSSMGTTGGQGGPNGTPASPLAIPIGYLTAQWLASASESTLDSHGDAVSRSTAAAHGVTLGGGIVTVGTVVSEANASSDGSTARLSGSSCASDVYVGGQEVLVDAQGIRAAGHPTGAPGLASLLGGVQPLLDAFGITLSVTAPKDSSQGSQASRLSEGLRISVDLSRFDSQARALASVLPAQLVDNLPLPPPDHQIVTIDVGWVDVSSGASVPFVDTGAGGDGGANAAFAAGDLGAATAASLGEAAPSGDFGSAPSSEATPPQAPLRHPAGFLTAVTGSPVFRGVGSGLLVLGIALASLLARGFLRVDSFLTGALAAPGGEGHGFPEEEEGGEP